MSSPAQNARPEPVTTTTRTASSICSPVNTSVMSRFIGCVVPLRCSGSFMVMVAMPSAFVATSKPRKRPSMLRQRNPPRSYEIHAPLPAGRSHKKGPGAETGPACVRMLGMATDLLYLRDAYLTEFDATVVAVDGGRVALDRTAFYPTGGGQPYDTGLLANFEVQSVRKEATSSGTTWAATASMSATRSTAS